LIAISYAKAGPLPPPPPPPLAPFLLNGTLFLNLIPRVDFVDFGHYSLFQPEPGPFAGDSRLRFTAFDAPPFLEAEIDTGKFQFGRATATLSYEMEVLGPQASVPIMIGASGLVFADVELDGSDTAVAQSNWRIEDVGVGPVPIPVP